MTVISLMWNTLKAAFLTQGITLWDDDWGQSFLSAQDGCPTSSGKQVSQEANGSLSKAITPWLWDDPGCHRELKILFICSLFLLYFCLLDAFCFCLGARHFKSQRNQLRDFHDFAHVASASSISRKVNRSDKTTPLGHFALMTKLKGMAERPYLRRNSIKCSGARVKSPRRHTTVSWVSNF